MKITNLDAIARFRQTDKFRQWLVTKGDETFNYHDNENCCFAQWLTYCGGVDCWLGSELIHNVDNSVMIPEHYVELMNAVLDKADSWSVIPFSEVLEVYDELDR